MLDRRPARREVALDAPTGGNGDQQAQNGSGEQNDLGLLLTLRRFGVAQRQQPLLFVLHFADNGLEFIHEPPAYPSFESLARPLQPAGSAYGNGRLCAPNLLSGQCFKGWNLVLLIGIIQRQVAKGRLALLHAQYVGAIGHEIGFIAAQGKTAGARFDSRHCDDQTGESLEDLVGVAHQLVALIGHDHGAIGDSAHDKQGQYRGAERDLDLPTPAGCGFRVAPNSARDERWIAGDGHGEKPSSPPTLAACGVARTLAGGLTCPVATSDRWRRC
jgi:hypothetical protein